MSEENYKQRHMNIPIEKHEAAPLANINKVKGKERLTEPSVESADYAKGWVDLNEK